MDAQATSVLNRIIRRIPNKNIENLLKKWNSLSADQLRALDYTRPKWMIVEHVINFCEENRLNLKHITNLEMIYHIENPDQGTWHACQLAEAQDDAVCVELTQFKEQFKAHLQGVIRNISIKMKKHEDEAIWIRIAWGDNFSKPNHLKPTYVVHHLHTSYVFISNLMAKHKIFLCQALVIATKHGSIKDGHLSTRSLTAMRDLLLRHYQQVFPNAHSRIPQERKTLSSHPCIGKEHSDHEEMRHQMSCEAFGHSPSPKLETAVYRLETRYRGNGNHTLSDREEFFRGVVRFSSSSLLDSLRHCVASGMAEGPVTPLLSAITQRGRNYFVITDKGPGVSSQASAPRA
ncbi:centromere protein N [Sinocyclocheilus rhinocerous]|uniref:Centromere protein N n=1 Tax=Sinocyclocheilus rhinocerous TaxID=307959 RepID=A0A673HEJ0_9TELE|nr:PREDICTED: centromere protein N [Sinocyclocheilus rhinocerous]